MLLPGLDGSGISFRPFVPHLPQWIKPVVVTYPPDHVLGYDQLLPLVLEAIPDSPFVLLGESFSSPLALMVAAKRPQGLRGLILCAAFARNPVWFRPGWLRHLARPFFFRLYPRYARIKAKLRARGDRELNELLAEAVSKIKPQVLANRIRCILQVDVMRELSACDVPVLYLRGDRDLMVPRHNLTEMAKCLPSMRVAHIPTVHWVLQAQPTAAAKAIVEFISTLPEDHDLDE